MRVRAIGAGILALAGILLGSAGISAGAATPAGTLNLPGPPGGWTCSNWPMWDTSTQRTITTTSYWQMCGATEPYIILRFQPNGNLVFLNGTTVVWSSGTVGGHTLTLQKNGNMTIYGCSAGNCASGDYKMWQTSTGVTGSGWNFLLLIAVNPSNFNQECVLLDEVEPNPPNTNHPHYIGPCTTV